MPFKHRAEILTALIVLYLKLKGSISSEFSFIIFLVLLNSQSPIITFMFIV